MRNPQWRGGEEVAAIADKGSNGSRLQDREEYSYLRDSARFLERVDTGRPWESTGQIIVAFLLGSIIGGLFLIAINEGLK